MFKSIIGDEDNFKIMNAILSDVLNKEVKVKRYLNVERKVNNKKEKGKTLDIVLETLDNDIIDIELNNKFDKSIKIRNLIYFSALYSETKKKGEKYQKIRNVYQINLNFKQNSNLEKEEYILKEINNNKKYLDNFKIINVNIAKYKSNWYNKNINKDKNHIYLTLLGCHKEEIDELSKVDELIKEVRDRMYQYNEDGTLTFTLSEEEEIELLNSIYYVNGLEDGEKKGKKQGIMSIVKNMLKLGMNEEDIAKISKLSLKEIEKIKNKK